MIAAEALIVPLADETRRRHAAALTRRRHFRSRCRSCAPKRTGETMRDLTSHPWAGAKVR